MLEIDIRAIPFFHFGSRSGAYCNHKDSISIQSLYQSLDDLIEAIEEIEMVALRRRSEYLNNSIPEGLEYFSNNDQEVQVSTDLELATQLNNIFKNIRCKLTHVTIGETGSDEEPKKEIATKIIQNE